MTWNVATDSVAASRPAVSIQRSVAVVRFNQLVATGSE
jgi:hypothetical protein